MKKVIVIQPPDSNKLASLITLSLSYQQYNPDSGLAYAQRALALAENLDNDMGIFGAENVLIKIDDCR